MPSKSPSIDLVLIRRSGAPAKPAKAALTRLLEHAWKTVPREHRPSQNRLALDILLVGDEEIAVFNLSHLKHRGPTDVLSFPLGEFDPERRAFHLGEIIASFETARREAAARELACEEELG